MRRRVGVDQLQVPSLQQQTLESSARVRLADNICHESGCRIAHRRKMEGKFEALARLERMAEAELARIRAAVQAVRDAETDLVSRKQKTSPPKALVLPGRVELDIGGKKFHTTAAALRSKTGFFAALCDGVGGAELDSEGLIFVDRSPVAFRFVLNHLRGQPIDLGALLVFLLLLRILK